MNESPDLSDDSNLRTAMELGCNLKKRHIYLSGEITDKTSSRVVMAFHELESMGSEESDIITLEVHTEGGCVHSMFKIYDTIRQSPCTVRTIGKGAVMSAGVWIVAAGDKGHRFCTETCQWMFHIGSSELSDEYAQAKVSFEHDENVKELMLKEITRRSKKRYTFWEELAESGKDHYFWPTKARQYGLIDKVITNARS